MPDSQTVVLFVAAMVAGGVCFRLYSVLGRRTGHEPQNDAALGTALSTLAGASARPTINIQGTVAA